MQKIILNTPTGKSSITTAGGINEIRNITSTPGCYVITDSNVFKYYSEYMMTKNIFVIEAGEKSKTLDTISNIYKQFLKAGIDRTSLIIGIGGGIVTDITGFAASTFMRGIPFGFISTTLLGCVDASLGGKNGVNFMGYKNMVGQFNQPDFVLCATECFTTLHPEEVKNGFAEVIKHGAIASAEYLEYINKYRTQALALNQETINSIVNQSVKIKTTIVQKDEKESGLRKILNFGHTIGHALEKLTSIPHGQAVAAGMVAAGAISSKIGLLTDNDFCYLCNLIESFGLPVKNDFKIPGLIEALTKDKKKEGNKINFILLEQLGLPKIEKLSINNLRSILNDL